MLKVCSTYYTAVNHKDKGTWDVVLLANSVFALLFFSFKFVSLHLHLETQG